MGVAALEWRVWLLPGDPAAARNMDEKLNVEYRMLNFELQKETQYFEIRHSLFDIQQFKKL